MPLSTLSDNSFDENNSFLEFKYPQDIIIGNFRIVKQKCYVLKLIN
jgi:hypothetical protein